MYSKVIMFLATSFFLVGCSDKAPDCSDSDTTDLVVQIANEQLVKLFGKEKAKLIKLSVETIRTTNVNEKVGSYECAADLRMTGENGSKTIPITYTSELADDGDSFYVNVGGL
jgi:hypothetical protein